MALLSGWSREFYQNFGFFLDNFDTEVCLWYKKGRLGDVMKLANWFLVVSYCLVFGAMEINILQLINYNSLMVKFTLKGAQDPADSSLQMKVLLYFSLRRGSILFWDGKYPPTKTPAPKYSPSASSLPTKSLPNPSSGTICAVSSRPRVLRDRS